MVTATEINTEPGCTRLSVMWLCDCGCGTVTTRWAGDPSPEWIVVLGTEERRKHDKTAFHFVDLDHLKAWACV